MRYSGLNIVDEDKSSSTTGAQIIMSETTATATATTREQAIEALKHVEANYRGYSAEFMQEPLVKILVGEDERRSRRPVATEFRNLIWTWFSGGGVADTVTKKVFTELGREAELAELN